MTERRLEPGNVLEAKLKKDRVVHNERVNKATEQRSPWTETRCRNLLLKALRLLHQGLTAKALVAREEEVMPEAGPVQARRLAQPDPGQARAEEAPESSLFGSADAPKFLQRIRPQYPSSARRRREEGRVVLKLTIDEKGTLMNVEVVESTGADFADAAVDAAKRSRFHTGQKK